MANLNFLKQILDENGNDMAVNGDIVVDKTTGVSFSQHHGNADIHLSTPERGYMTKAGSAGGVALLDASGHLPSGVFDTTKHPVEITVTNIAARDALVGLASGAKVFVEDASDDASVLTGWAIYRANPATEAVYTKTADSAYNGSKTYYTEAGGVYKAYTGAAAGWSAAVANLYEQVAAATAASFTKVSEGESLDVVTNWANITGKPTSSAVGIDEAVSKKHDHANKAALDGLSAHATSGNLQFNGKELNGETGISFVAKAGDTPAFTGKMVFVVENYVRPTV